jgi:hypothetical protein
VRVDDEVGAVLKADFAGIVFCRNLFFAEILGAKNQRPGD